MSKDKKTSSQIASQASSLLKDTKTPKKVKSVAASALSQATGGRKKPNKPTK